MASLLGGDNNLAVVIAGYEPNVRCGGRLSKVFAISCSRLASTMPAGTGPTYFGNRTRDPRVQEPLPQSLTYGKNALYLIIISIHTIKRRRLMIQNDTEDRQCWTRIDSSGTETVIASWFQLWEGMAALNSMCARQGRKGVARRLGKVFLSSS